MRKGLIVFCITVLGIFFTHPLEAQGTGDDSAFDRDMAAVQRMLQMGRGEEALRELRRMVGAYPNRPRVHFLLGLTAVRLSGTSGLAVDARNRLLEEAITAFKWVLDYESRRGNGSLPTRVLLELGQAHFLKGEDAQARPYFMQVIQQNVSQEASARARAYLGAIQQRNSSRTGQGTGEVSPFQKEMAGVERLIKAGRREEALKELRRLKGVYPDRPQVYFLLGLMAVDLAKDPQRERTEGLALLDEAIAAFEWILDYESRQGAEPPVRVLLELGQIHFIKGETQKAEQYFIKVKEMNHSPEATAQAQGFLNTIAAGKNSPPAQVEKEVDPAFAKDIKAVRELLKAGKLKEALGKLRMFAKDNYSENSQIHFLLGVTASNLAQKPETEEEERSGLLDEAITAFEWVLDYESGQGNPPPVRVLMEIGHIHFLKGETDKARGYFEKVLESKPGEQDAANVENLLKAIEVIETESEFNQDIEAVQKLMGESKLKEALEKLRVLAKDVYPERAQVHFLLGLTAGNLAHNQELGEEERRALFDEAISAFEWILEYESKQGNPAPTRILLEVGKVHFFKGETDKAKEYFDRILESEPSEEIAANVGAFLKAIEEGVTIVVGQELTPFDKDMMAVQELLAAGKGEEALTELRRLATEVYPERTEAHFQLGLTALDLAHNPDHSKEKREELLNEALAVFQRVLEKESQDGKEPHNRILLEIGRTYFLQQEDKEAKKYFAAVLERDLPPDVAQSVNAFLNTIRQRKPWYVRMEVSLVYDSNMGSVDEEQEVVINGLPFQRNSGNEINSGMGMNIALNGGYRHMTDSGLELNFGANIFHKNYPGYQYDTTTITLSVGSFVGYKRVSFEPAFFLRNHLNAGDTEYTDLGIRMHFNIATPYPRLQLGGNASWYRRRYDDNEDLNGPGGDLGLRASFALHPRARLNFKVGHEFRDPDNSIKSRYKRRFVEPGFEMEFEKGLSFSFSHRLQRTQYEGPWRPFNIGDQARKDRTKSTRFEFRHRKFRLMNFDPRFAFIFDERTSNAQLHTYDRFRVEMGFARVW